MSDWALIELRVRDVGSSDTPLVGPFSRFGWNHPGPAMFWLLAIPYRLMGSASVVLLFGAGLVNLAAVGGIGWLAHRRGGMSLLAWTTVLFSLFLLGRGPFLLVDPWNPSVVVLPYALLILLCWSLAEGEHRLFPLTVLVASWVVQGHIGFAPLVAASLLWGVGWLLARHRSPVMWRWLAAGFAVGFVVWLPPLVEQVTESPGNMAEVARHFAGLGHAEGVVDPESVESVGVGQTAELFSRHLAPVGVWLGGDEPSDFFTGGLIGAPAWHGIPLVLLLFGTGAVAWWRGATDAVLLAGQTALGLVVGFAVTTRIDGVAFPYLFGWLEVLAVCCWLSAGWCLYRVLPGPTREHVDRRGVHVLLGVSVVLIAFATVRSFGVEPDLPVTSEAARATASDVDAALDAALDGRAVLLSPYGLCFHEVAFGVALQVERSGRSIVVSGEFPLHFGEGRRWAEGDAAVELLVGCTDAATPAAIQEAEDEGFELISEWDPTPPELASRADEIEAALIAEIDRLGRPELLDQIDNHLILFTGIDAGIDPEVLAEYQALVEPRRQRIVVMIDTELGPE